MNKAICQYITGLQIRTLKQTPHTKEECEGLQYGPSFTTRSCTALLFDSLTGQVQM